VKMGAQEARERFSEALDAVLRGEHVVITRHGRALAGMMPAFEMAMIEVLTSEEWKQLKERAEAGK